MPSRALRLADLRAVYELLHECRDLGDDPIVWSSHLLAGAARLVDADVAACAEVAAGVMGPDRSFGLVEMRWGLGWGWAENGFDPAGAEWAGAESRSNPRFDPFINAYWPRAASSPGLALTSAHALSEKELHASAAYQRSVAACGLDARVISFHPVPREQNAFVDVLLGRATRRRDFSARECALVRELVTALSPLFGGSLARPPEPSPGALPRRAKQVLRCLLEGDSDKQAAARLRISKYTVNQYVRAIFGHFGVSTRAELLARWVRRGWGARCAWSDDEGRAVGGGVGLIHLGPF